MAERKKQIDKRTSEYGVTRNETHTKPKYTVRMEKELKDKFVSTYCAKHGLTFNAGVVKLIEQVIEQ